MQHSFDISIAEKYGVQIAIFLNNMAFWIKKNQANKKHFHDGRYWTYNTMEAYTELFPYWTFKQIRTLLNNLKAEGLIQVGNYNLTSYDRTQWYAMTDFAHQLLHIPICPNGQIEVTEKANRFDEKGKPIPDIKPDIKPDKNKKRVKKHPLSKTTVIPVHFEPNEKHKQLAVQLNLDLQKEKESFIDYYTAHGKRMVNWNAAFNNWLRKSSQFGKKIHPVTAAIRDIKEDIRKHKDFKTFLN